MHDTTTVIILTAVITALVLLTLGMLLASVIRRGYNEKKYRELDRLRDHYRRCLREALTAGRLQGRTAEFAARPKTARWQAIEDVLLEAIAGSPDEIGGVLSKLGYPAFYEARLSGGNVQKRALNIDKLGRMRSEGSILKLAPLLADKEPEIVAVTLRSLSRIGGRDGLAAIVEYLPRLFSNGFVASKAMEAALLAFGTDIIPPLTAKEDGYGNPRSVAIILETLSRLPTDRRSALLASGHLGDQEAEVRSKALNVLGRPDYLAVIPNLPARIVPLLADPAWFVRLQAIRSLSALGHAEVIGDLGKLVHAGQWQVRNEAARAIIYFGECSLDFLLGVLEGDDRYAKDSVCEELENTNYCAQLMQHLTAEDEALRRKSYRVLELMHALGFSTPHEEYCAQGEKEGVKQQIQGILAQTVNE